MKASIVAAIQGLRDELTTVDERITQLGAELTATKQQKSELERALKTLLRLANGEEGVTSASATKDLVRPLVQTLLADNGPMSRDDLYDLVREKLAEQSVSANGLGLRMKEVLSEPWIEETAPSVFAPTGKSMAI